MLKASRYKLISLDTNIFVYYFQKNPQFGPIVKNLFQDFSKFKTEIITSSISLTELLSVKTSFVLINTLQQEFLSIPFLETIPVSNNIAIEAARIRRIYEFKLADSIQLATAIKSKAEVFITNDDKLKKFKELKVVLLSEIK